MATYYRFDLEGWFIGTSPFPVRLATYKPTPSTPLQDGEKWRFVSDNWVAEIYVPPVPTPQPDPVPTFYLHLAMTDGDGQMPIGIKNDGVDKVNIVYSLRTTSADDSPVAPIPDGRYRINIRDSDELVYDVISILFTSGAGVIDYTSTMRPAVISLDVSDLSVPGVEVTFEIVNPDSNTIKIYREL